MHKHFKIYEIWCSGEKLNAQKRNKKLSILGSMCIDMKCCDG
jgi:hypothetical protein